MKPVLLALTFLSEEHRIIERGTHAQLLALNGRYASMWALQQSDGAA